MTKVIWFKDDIELLRKKLSHCLVDSCTGCPAQQKMTGMPCKAYSKGKVIVPHALVTEMLDVLDELCEEDMDVLHGED